MLCIRLQLYNYTPQTVIADHDERVFESSKLKTSGLSVLSGSTIMSYILIRVQIKLMHGNALTSVVQILLTYEPFYKNVTICGPLPTKMTL